MMMTGNYRGRLAIGRRPLLLAGAAAAILAPPLALLIAAFVDPISAAIGGDRLFSGIVGSIPLLLAMTAMSMIVVGWAFAGIIEWASRRNSWLGPAASFLLTFGVAWPFLTAGTIVSYAPFTIGLDILFAGIIFTAVYVATRNGKTHG